MNSTLGQSGQLPLPASCFQPWLLIGTKPTFPLQ